MNRDELLALPASVDLVTAAKALGIGRTTAYQLARSGELPVPVLRLGVRYRVPTAALLHVLGISSDKGPPSHAPAALQAV
ncbi:MAG: helix-turn-helix domain-containing protein [Actinomycetota bacterium]|nr:helix-turn-helix domain-containing protein [Actinomycetota bacterium]